VIVVVQSTSFIFLTDSLYQHEGKVKANDRINMKVKSRPMIASTWR